MSDGSGMNHFQHWRQRTIKRRSLPHDKSELLRLRRQTSCGRVQPRHCGAQMSASRPCMLHSSVSMDAAFSNTGSRHSLTLVIATSCPQSCGEDEVASLSSTSKLMRALDRGHDRQIKYVWVAPRRIMLL
eukprot:5574218-Pleurochrysis_carterae.AAC.5